MLTLFSAIAPVFLTILAGIIVERLRILPRDTEQVLGILIIRFCLPCMLFHFFSQVTEEQLTKGWWWLCVLGYQAIIMVGVALAEKLRGARKGDAMISGLQASFSNVAFMGLPIILSVYPGNTEAAVVCGLLIISINTIAIPGQVMLEIWSKKERGDSLPEGFLGHAAYILRHYLLGNLLLVACVLGLVVALCGIPVWDPLARAIEGIGALSPITMLLALGLGLREKLQRALGAGSGMLLRQLWLLACKLVVGPALVGGFLVLAGCTGVWVAVPVIIAGTGTAVITALFAELYRTRPEEASLNVAVSNVVCLATIMGWLAVLQHFGYLG